MKSKYVLSVEQMEHLQELGLDTSDGSMCFEWNESDSDNMVVPLRMPIRITTIIMKLTLCRTFSISCRLS